MDQFQRETLTVNGVRIVAYTAGAGEPLLFLHGAGTFHGFEFARQWTDQYRVIVPYHPGWGESDDGAQLTDMHDYVMHYVELLDQLGIERVNLVGFSLGGYMAAKIASLYPERVRKLVLVAPAGLRDPEHPTADVLALPPEKLLPMLASDFSVVARHLPAGPDLDFMGDRYREATATAKLMWERPFDPKMGRYAHRMRMPVLFVWGDEDALIPVQQLETWRSLVPRSEAAVFKGAGHLVLDEKPEAARAVAQFLH